MLPLSLAGVALAARPSGALWWAQARALVVADLHLGRSERMARRRGLLAPPYETRDTLDRLSQEIEALGPDQVICLGDSFDDAAAATALTPGDRATIETLVRARRWLWVTGNHDPVLPGLPGQVVAELRLDGLTLRHIAEPDATAEISAHYHPKMRLGGVRRPCFLLDARRLILPAFGTYTGGMEVTEPPLATLMGPGAQAILCGASSVRVPVRGRAA